MGKNIYVGGLAYSTTQDEVSKLFEGFGPVEKASLITDRDSGNSKGFAFVEMASEEDAQKAITELNGTEFGGRKLVVNEALPKDPNRSTGGGGNRSFGGNGGGGFSNNRSGGPRY
jgi:RNA recognition motif-containing protein